MTTRQHMACGYEAPLATGAAQPWAPSYMETTVCPGYTTALPAVAEVLGEYVQWEARTLTESIGSAPTDQALVCLSRLKAGINEHAAAEMKARAKGGA